MSAPAVQGSCATGLASVEAALASVHPILHRAEVAAVGLGVPIAPLYLASARGSLRHVSACLAHHAARSEGGIADEVVCGSDVRLVPVDGHPGLGQRTGPRDDSAVEVSAWRKRPDLGADLVASPGAAAFCAGPVGSTLLFCALAHHRWLHPASRARWSTDASGAQALVSAINGGASCETPVAGPLVTLVDAEVVAMFAMLGWTRMLSPPMP